MPASTKYDKPSGIQTIDDGQELPEGMEYACQF